MIGAMVQKSEGSGGRWTWGLRRTMVRKVTKEDGGVTKVTKEDGGMTKVTKEDGGVTKVTMEDGGVLRPFSFYLKGWFVRKESN